MSPASESAFASGPLSGDQTGSLLGRWWRGIVGEFMHEAKASPRIWFGFITNISFAAVWFLLDPVSTDNHRNWVLGILTFVCTFVLSDAATTNMLGADAPRIHRLLTKGASGFRLIVTKNIALFTLIGIPLVCADFAMTCTLESSRRLAVNIPALLDMILVWMSIGSVLSVAVPVVRHPFVARMLHRNQISQTVWWAIHLCIPPALVWLLFPIADGPSHAPFLGLINFRHLFRHWDQALLFGFAVWVVGVMVATLILRTYGFHPHDYREGVPVAPLPPIVERIVRMWELLPQVLIAPVWWLLRRSRSRR